VRVTFPIEDLEREVAPEELKDILNTLMQTGFIESYLYDFRGGTVTLDVPRDVEVAEIMAGFTQLPITGRKRIQ
jgi:hypothetical protein